MEIKAAWGLGKLKQKVKHDLEKVLGERRKLGLAVPEDVEVRLRYSSNNSEFAFACLENLVPVITINLLQSTAQRFKGEEKDALNTLSWYFDITRHILDDDNEVLAAMRHPVKVICSYENSVGKKELQSIKQDLEDNGRKYSSEKNQIIKNAKKARKIFRKIKPKIERRFAKLSMSESSLRHEIDHAAFFKSAIDTNYRENVESELMLSDIAEQESYEQLAKIQNKMLTLSTERDVLIESRALFFDCIPFNHWELVDYEKVKKKVYSFFQYNYIESVIPAEVILPAMISKYAVKKAFTAETAEYLKKLVYFQAGDICKAKDIVIKTPGVDFNIANQIFYAEIPHWKQQYAWNATAAIDAIGDALRDDPARFKKADLEARTFSHYLKILKGGKSKVL